MPESNCAEYISQRFLRQFVYLDYYVQANLTEEDIYHVKSHAGTQAFPTHLWVLS